MPNPMNPSGGAVPPGDPDVHLQRLTTPQILDLPWYGSLYRDLRELIRPPRLPPLELTSQPVVVKDIWGLYGRQKKSFLMSAGFQAAVIGAVVLAGLSSRPVPTHPAAPTQPVYLEPPPAHIRIVHSTKPDGGGGGDGSNVPPSRGKMAPSAFRQWVPPKADINDPDAKLTMNPSILAVDAVYTDDPSIKNYGLPWAPDGPLSNGPGHDGGIGENGGHGVGRGHGPGGGPGPGGPGFGDPVFVAERNLINPVALYKPEPDYSEDARKAKLQGTVLLEVVVDRNGHPQIRKVLQSLGLGLDEQAIKTVSTWRFKPGTKDGKPVPVLINVYVSFRLL